MDGGTFTRGPWPHPGLSWWTLSLQVGGVKPHWVPLQPPLSCTFPRQLYAKLQAVKAEIQDQHDEYIRVRQDLEEAQNEQTRDLKLK